MGTCGRARPASILYKRIVRSAIGALGLAGLLDGQIDLGVGVPQAHARHRTAERQIIPANLVAIFRIGLDEPVVRGAF